MSKTRTLWRRGLLPSLTWWSRPVDVQAPPQTHRHSSSVVPPQYQLLNGGALLQGRLFISPAQARRWILQLLECYHYAEADRVAARMV